MYVGELVVPGFAVTVVDSTGILIDTATATITLSIHGLADNALTGRREVRAAGGVARFDAISITQPAGAVRLYATAPGMRMDSTSPFAVLRRPAVRLEFTAVPGNTAQGVTMPRLVVQLFDARGARAVSDSTTMVTLGVLAPDGAPHGASYLSRAGRGLATFDSVQVDGLGAGYRLVATASGLAGDTSAPFDVLTSVKFAPGALALSHAASCALGQNGEAYCWGDNLSGQIGDGAPLRYLEPVQVRGGHRFTALSAQSSSVCGTTAGEVLCWGLLWYTREQHSLPARFAGLALTTLDATSGHSCGLQSTGEAWCWGRNDNGQLGNGTGSAQQPVLQPVPVAGGLRFTDIAVGGRHTCALAIDSIAYCWGTGPIGVDAWDAQETTPVPVAGGLRFVSIDAGSGHTCALAGDGSAYCWGGGGEPALGLGRNGEGYPISSRVPAAVVGGHRFRKLATGPFGTCGITESGATYCWGNAGLTPFGNESAVPVLIEGAPPFADVVVEHTACGLTSLGEAWCWGPNDEGQLGDGTRTPRQAPVRVAGATRFVAITAGYLATCGLTAAGEAWCWGSDRYGEAGQNRRYLRPYAAPVHGGGQFSAIVMGFSHACALRGATPFCWGQGHYGTLGNGRREDSTAPQPVQFGGEIADITANVGHHACGRTAAGRTSCWGHVGPWWGTPTPPQETWITTLPQEVSGPSFAAVSAGFAHRCGLTADGQAWCWAFNGTGQLGDGTTLNHMEPTPVSGGHRFASISAGGGHTCALTSEGEAWCWGHRFTTVPTRAMPELRFVGLTTGTDHTCGLTAAGEAWCWGRNDKGQLGIANPIAPSGRVAGDLRFVTIAAGGNHSCAATAAGDVYCWGANGSGQLGNGSTSASSQPVLVVGVPRASPVTGVSPRHVPARVRGAAATTRPPTRSRY